MLIIADSRIPQKAKERLSGFGELYEFSTNGITYDAVSGHPDIFFCKSGDSLITAPNTPSECLSVVRDNGIDHIQGKSPVGAKYPESARYNAVVDDGCVIHKTAITDTTILDSASERINIPQGYARCSLVRVAPRAFITSDKGIMKVLETMEGFDTLYVNPDGIMLPGFRNGFLGGTCGVYEGTIFFAGSLRYIQEGNKVEAFLHKYKLDIIELYDGPLYDGGSILFL